MRKIREILEECYQVNFTSKEHLSIGEGILDESVLSNRKKQILSFATHYLKEDFVEVHKGFPEKGEVEVEFSLDFVVLKGEDYRRLMKLIENE